MNFLSLFNGFGGLALVLEMLGITPKKIYSSEIDKYANQAAQALYPDTIQIGDITKWRDWDIDFSKIDLLTAGFPCQAWSMAGKMEGDNDPRGALVHDLIDIWTEIKKQNPNVKFMFENVKMKKEFVNYVNKLFGVEPILINSSLVCAQIRNRNYWNNLGCVDQPEVMNIQWGDVREWGVDDRFYYSEKAFNWICRHAKRKGKDLTLYTTKGKMQMVEASHYKNYSSQRFFGVLDHKGVRYVTPRECARLQGIPEHKIDILLNCGISNTQLYKMIGNGWQLDTVKHVLGNLKPYT